MQLLTIKLTAHLDNEDRDLCDLFIDYNNLTAFLNNNGIDYTVELDLEGDDHVPDLRGTSPTTGPAR